MLESVKRHFEKYGEIEKVIFRGKTKFKFGFVTFKLPASAAAAIEHKIQFIGDKKIQVKPATKKQPNTNKNRTVAQKSTKSTISDDDYFDDFKDAFFECNDYEDSFDLPYDSDIDDIFFEALEEFDSELNDYSDFELDSHWFSNYFD